MDPCVVLYWGGKRKWFILISSSQGVAVLGIALIAMGEEIGSEMALRTFGHLVSSTAYCQFSILVYIN